MNITLLNSQANTPKLHKQNPIKFCAINNVLSFKATALKPSKALVTDVFEFNNENLNKIYKTSLDNIWKRIKEQTASFTPEKLEKVISDVKSSHPKNSEKEILTVMQKITQWGNYNCFEKLSEKLNKIKFNQVHFTISHTEIQNIFYYLLNRKTLCDINTENNINYSFVTKGDLKKIYKCGNNYYNNYINLEGFEDGINFITDNDKLTEVTRNVLTKVNNLSRKRPFASFNKILYRVLNGEIESEMKKIGVICKTIKIDNPATRDSILQQLSPICPESKESVDTILNVIANEFEPKIKNRALLLKTKIAQFYEQKLDIYTKERLVNLMKEMNDKIINFQKENNLSTENIYYAVDKDTKSCGLITYMFANVNNIPKEKVISYLNDSNEYPPNATIVLLDDVAISGDSLKKIKTDKLLPNQKVLYCPLIAHTTAISEKNKSILSSDRKNDDKILYTLLKDDNLSLDEIEEDLIKYFYNSAERIVLGDIGYNKIDFKSLGGCTVLPYMSPDNNVGLASFLLYKFVSNPNALKSQHSYLYDIIDKVNKQNLA